MGMITNCTEQFLPNMVDCPGVFASKGEEEAMKCFHNHLSDLDPMGEALAIAKMTEKQWDQKWEFVLGASCIAASMVDGEMNCGQVCGKCFDEADWLMDLSTAPSNRLKLLSRKRLSSWVPCQQNQSLTAAAPKSRL